MPENTPNSDSIPAIAKIYDDIDSGASVTLEITDLQGQSFSCQLAGVIKETTVILADWERHREMLLSVRYAVFVEEQGIPESIEVDAADETAIHRLALDPGGHPIATARLLQNGRIGRVAVLENWRRRGIGSSLITALLQDAAKQGCKQVVLHAQLSSLAFYEQLGFEPRGDIFDEVGIPHREMIRAV